MTVLVSLPVLLPFVPHQRWSCHSCGNCCRSLVGHLLPADKERIDRQGWAERLDVAPYVRAGRGFALNKQADGACVFLDEHNRCRIHAEFGEAEKPLACRIFPFSVRAVDGAWQASLRFDCPSVTSSKGALIGEHRAWLAELVRALPHAPPRDAAAARLDRATLATPAELDALQSRLLRLLRNNDRPLRQRLLTVARLTTMLSNATFEKVRGPRFEELLDLLFGAADDEFGRDAPPPTARQRGMLRQIAFAHAEHVTLAELRGGLWSGISKRFAQLSRARRFRTGEGMAPQLPGFGGGVHFAAVEGVIWTPETSAEVEPLLLRYLIARLEGRSVWGAGYYGWGVFPGLAALLLSIAATGWLARYAAAAGGRSEATFDDTALALGIVDRAATRVPSLGSAAERVRVSYLMRDDGLAALLGAYAPLPEQ